MALVFPSYTIKKGVLTEPCPRLTYRHSNRKGKVAEIVCDVVRIGRMPKMNGHTISAGLGRDLKGENNNLESDKIMILNENKQASLPKNVKKKIGGGLMHQLGSKVDDYAQGMICGTESESADENYHVGRRSTMTGLFMSGLMVLEANLPKPASALTPVFREYIDTFDGYSFQYPQNWIQVRGAGADIFFRDPFVLDENVCVEFSSPSSSKYQSLEDLGTPEEAGQKVLRQYLTEFMSTRLGVRRESNILTTSSTVADDGKLYYQIEVNIKSYANNNELAVMPQDRVARLEWDRRYLAVLGVENNRLYSLRLQTPEKVFKEEEKDLRRVMDSFRVEKI